MIGGMIVVGLVTGDHYLEDIQVVVPHKVAVPISPEQALRSKDLYKALQQGRIFKLDGGTGVVPEIKPQPVPQIEESRLKSELKASERRNVALESELGAIKSQLGSILELLRSGASVPAQASASVLAPITPPPSDVVEVDVPMFIPNTIKPEDVEARIDVKKDVSGDTGLSDAAAKLRKLRKG